MEEQELKIDNAPLVNVEGLKGKDYVPLTGEEDEDCIMQLRLKLFKLEEVVDISSQPNQMKTESDGLKSSISKTSKDSSEKKDDSKQVETTNKEEPKTKKEWKELGIGPCRILEKKTDKEEEEEGKMKTSYRLVIRREHKPNGPGIVVMLNTIVKQGNMLIASHTDNTIRMVTLSGKDVVVSNTYLLRCKTKDEKEKLFKQIETRLL